MDVDVDEPPDPDPDPDPEPDMIDFFLNLHLKNATGSSVAIQGLEEDRGKVLCVNVVVSYV